MFIINQDWECGIGETLEKAVTDFENNTGNNFDPEIHSIYEAKEIKVQRKFEIVKED